MTILEIDSRDIEASNLDERYALANLRRCLGQEPGAHRGTGAET